MICEIGAGDLLQPLAGRHRLSGDMAVDPLHGIGRGERQCAREHLVERDAERVEVAAGIDRAVHPPGLFGRHIGERAGDDLGRLGRLPLARQTRGDAEAGEPDLSARAVHQDIGRLDVLVDEPGLVDLAQGDRDADGEVQEASHLHRRAEQPLERLAALILQHQHGPAAVADELQRPRRPGSVQLVLQSIFVGQAIEGGRCRMLRGGQHGQHGVPAAIGIQAPPTAEDAVAVLPQDLEVVVSLCAEPRRCAQLPHSTIGLAARGLEGRCAPSPARLIRPRLSKKSAEEEVCHIPCGLAMSDCGTRGRTGHRPL